MFTGGADKVPWAITGNLRGLDPAIIKKNKNGDIHTKLGLTRRREFGGVMSGNTLTTLPTP